MASFAKVTIVGHAGRDPELRYTPQGTAVCNFSVATSEKRKGQGQDGNGEETTTWWRIVLWGRQAEIAAQYITKGRQVYVDGRPKLTEYTDRDGNKRSSLEVTAESFQMLGGNPSGEQSGERNPQHAAAMNAQAPPQNRGRGVSPVEWNDLAHEDGDSSIPF